MRNRSQKNAETLLLEPTKNVTDGTAKPKKKVFGERMRKSRTQAGFVLKPCKTVAKKTLETSPTKRTILKDSKTSKPCETAARKMPKRCFWNPLKTRQNPRKRCVGSACEKAVPKLPQRPDFSACEKAVPKLPQRPDWKKDSKTSKTSALLKNSKTSKTSPTERQSPRKRSLGSACETSTGWEAT